MRTPTTRLALAALLCAAFLAPAGCDRATSGARLDRLLAGYVDRGEIAGAVALILRDGHVVYERAVGMSDVEARRPMRPDAIFRIASQTKAVMSVAAMILVEEGKLALADPVSRFIPGFARTTVVSATGVAPAKRAITVRDLLTQTAGLSYGGEDAIRARYAAAGLGPSAGRGWYFADKDEPVCSTVERLATLPFVAQPGEAWVYGYGSDVLGCVVERASGTPLDVFLRTRITGPLDMRDTSFYVPAAQRDRLVTVYASGPAGAPITRAPDGALGQGHYVDGPRRSFSGGAGLLSTARDYARFLQMLANGGTLDGTRILAPASVALMTSDGVGALYPKIGLGFGFGVETVARPGTGSPGNPGTYGWGGAYGSMYFVDPSARLVYAFMVNQLPLRSDVAERFPKLVYEVLVGGR